MRERRGIGLAVLSGLSWQGAAILTPVFAAEAIDAIGEGDRNAVYVWAAIVIVFGLLESAAGAGRHVFAMRNRAHGLAHVRDAVLLQALRLDARFHDRFPPGELMSRSAADAEVVSRVLDASGHTFGYLVTVVGVSIVLLVLDATLALIILAPLPILVVGFWRYARRYSSRTKLYQEELGHTSALVEETVAGIRVVKGLGASAALSNRFLDASERVRQRALDVASVDAVFLPALELVPALVQVLVLWFGGQQVLDGELARRRVRRFQRVRRHPRVAAAGARPADLDAPERARRGGANRRGGRAEPAVVDPAEPRSLDTAPHGAEVHFAGVRFGYDERSPVLDGFDLHVEAGASVALVGGQAAARAPSPRCSPVSTTCRRAPSCSTAWTCASSRWGSFARRSRS